MVNIENEIKCELTRVDGLVLDFIRHLEYYNNYFGFLVRDKDFKDYRFIVKMEESKELERIGYLDTQDLNNDVDKFRNIFVGKNISVDGTFLKDAFGVKYLMLNKILDI